MMGLISKITLVTLSLLYGTDTHMSFCIRDIPLTSLTGVAAVDCGTTVINSTADAEALRNNCKTVHGSVLLGDGIAESISLDGVEIIEGDLSHYGCREVSEKCNIPPPFNVSSTTLSLINGDLSFFYFQGLEKLVLPNLSKINGSMFLQRVHNLTSLDITSLVSVGAIVIEAVNLINLHHNGLQNCTGGPSGLGISIWAAAVDSVDSFYKNPVYMPPEFLDAASGIGLGPGLPNVRKVTIGWPYVAHLSIRSDNPNQTLDVTLGGPSTTTMEIDKITVQRGLSSLERGANVKNLTVNNLRFIETSNVTHLKLPFNQLSNVEILDQDQLQSIELPPQAVDWENLQLTISGNQHLNLSSEYTVNQQGQPTRTWYWPQKDMKSVSIHGKISNDFL
jgi:hypothetical protein